MKPNILFEDNHLIAVYKPAGVLVQGDSSRNPSLLEVTKAYLKEKYQKPGKVYLGLVHRLDQPVEGIVVFGKTTKGASRLSEQFRNHQVEKTYFAVVEGVPKKPQGTISSRIVKNNQKAELSDSGKESFLRYEVIRSNGSFSLLKVSPESGRFHQIRLQLASIGNPVVGDRKYGSQVPFNSGIICLGGLEIRFKTAVSKEVISLKAPIPVAWKAFLGP